MEATHNTPAHKRLQDLAEIIFISIANVEAMAPSRRQAEERHALRCRLGTDWDAVNRTWIPYTETEGMQAPKVRR